MIAADSMDRRKKLVIFSLILLATAGITSVLTATLIRKEGDAPLTITGNVKSPVNEPARYNSILSANEVLAGRLNTLQLLDQRYAGLLTEPGNKTSLDSLTQQIYVQEEIFRGSIDSIFLNLPNLPDTALNKLFTNIVASYKSILENRHTMGSLRNAINLDKKNLNPGEMATLKNQNELQEKNNRIASLESALKSLSASNNRGIAVSQVKEVPNENIGALKENIKEQENRLIALSAANNTLKQDNERLLKQQADPPKTMGTSELFFKNKTAGLQQRIDELNAELSLARVDCNLTRVDAGQIISNSRQRKELLSEASGILTGLAKSDDAGIKKKVQDKIARLNQVAANSRD